jgi:hypothetical protein
MLPPRPAPGVWVRSSPETKDVQRPCLASCRALALALFTFALVSSYASGALALDAGAEGAAKAAFQSTEDDFLAGSYTKAIATLKKAAAGCGADKCSPATKAHVFRDLGAMYFYAKDNASASGAFVEALKIEPGAPLNITYKTPDVEAIYDAAKTKVPAGGGGGGGGAAAGGGGGAAGGGDVPAGEFGVEPPTEGLQHAPFPVYATYAGSTELAKVQAKYKGTGMTEFKPLTLVKKGDGWGGYVPCADVVQGTLQFYVQGFDANNDPVANTGSQKKPFKVKIQATLAGDPPALPGDEAPKQCKDTSDCPPDFPGCNKKADSSKLGEGEECDEDTQCASSTCLHNKCTAPDDSDSGGGGGTGKFHRVWLGLSLGLDFDVLPSANDVCKLNAMGNGPFTSGSAYACVDSSGADFPGTGPTGGATNMLIKPGASDQVSGGMNPSNFRILLSLDVAATPNILIGVRAGYVANTYPGSTLSKFPPLDFEARGTYVIGKDALKKDSGISPIVFVGAGVAEFDSHVSVTVIPTDASKGPQLSEKAWVTSGPVFFTLGGGIRVLLSSRAALTLAGKFTGAVGNVFLPVLSPELGIQIGL